jgi:hypothetical protein
MVDCSGRLKQQGDEMNTTLRVIAANEARARRIYGIDNTVPLNASALTATEQIEFGPDCHAYELNNLVHAAHICHNRIAAAAPGWSQR